MFPIYEFSWNFSKGDLVTTEPTTSDFEGIDITFYPIWFQETGLSWTFPKEWTEVTFNVYRSDEAWDLFVKCNVIPLTSNHFNDLDALAVSKFREDYYKIEAVFPDGTTIMSTPQTWENKQSKWVNLRARDINRRENILLRKFVGVKSRLYHRHFFGQHCPNCWDTASEKSLNSRCPVCLGTSWRDGYQTGRDLYIQYEPTPNGPRPTYGGWDEGNSIPAWTTAFPQIQALDLIIRIGDRRIYRVEAVQTTELQAVPVRQSLQLLELDRDAVEYRLLNDIYPSDVQIKEGYRL